MLNLKPVIYKPLSSHSTFNAETLNNICSVADENGNEIQIQCVSINEKLMMKIIKNDFFLNDNALLVAVEYILGHHSELRQIEIDGFQGNKTENILAKYFTTKEGTISFNRASFFQLRAPWHIERDFLTPIENWTTSADNRIHPIRPDVQSGVLYSRYVPEIGKNLSFRMIDNDLDLDTFHDWHNQPRVSNFWELAQPKAELSQFINKGLSDPHTLPMIAECNGIPVGYFEMYWTREDRLAPYYESEAFDRGFHFLIGNKDFLGFANTDAILKSLTHFLFLDEVRTRKIMAEPRSDNTKVFKYLETFTAWKKLYEFDFPHKHAALLECKREAFFMGYFI